MGSKVSIIQGSAKAIPGLVNFVIAVAYYFCLALPAAFTQPGSYLLSNHVPFTLQVWKAEADNICGYEGTVLVGVKAAKDNAPQKEVGHLHFIFNIIYYLYYVLYLFNIILSNFRWATCSRR